ncbi:hypothetical protein [Psychromonas aquatilis]|uniref:Uncharacterized protein n=1 Tax=Psychromonas aquatilis TaxID=2005072 RepID=A0ABU9GRK6_9GAMM
MSVFDVSKLSLEELNKEFEKAKEIISKKELFQEELKENLEFISTLDNDYKKCIAVDLLLPFIVDNINLSREKDKIKELQQKISPSLDKEKKPRAVKKQRYQLFNVNELEEKAPHFHKYLTTNEGCGLHLQDPKFLVVYRKRYNDQANEAAILDGFETSKELLDKLAKKEAIVSPQLTEEPTSIDLSYFKEV